MRSLCFYLAICAFLCTAIRLPAQRLKWALEPYGGAEFTREIESRSTILETRGEQAPEQALRALLGTPSRGNRIANPSFEKRLRGKSYRWYRILYDGAAKLEHAPKVGRTGKRSLHVRTQRRADAAWTCAVKVVPNRRYRLSGFVRTSDIAWGNGAQLCVAELGERAVSQAVIGTHDWTRIELSFETGAHKRVSIQCALGARSRSSGQAWFDDLTLVEVASKRAPAQLLEDAIFGRGRRDRRVRYEELGPKQQGFRELPADLRDLAAHVAFDLRRSDRAAKINKKPLQPRGFKNHWMEASYGAADLEGRQKIRIRIRPERLARRRSARQPKKKGKKAKPAPPLLSATGELVVIRRLDAANGRVAGFDSELRVDVEVPDGHTRLSGVHSCRVDVKETWSWRRTTGPEDSIFRARVHRAIASGGRYLRGLAGRQNLAPGRLGLCVLTLLKSGSSPKDPLIRRLVARLRKAKIVKTYDCATAIMAVEALYAPAGERDALMSGRLQKPVERKPSPEDFAALQRWTKTLLRNVDKRVDPAYILRFNYTPAPRYDNSNCQYAMLGLYTASLCGVEISPQVWFASANHWLQVQGRAEGQARHLALESYVEEAEASGSKKSRRTETRGASVRARGWGYGTRGMSGSMTTAGITGLVICDAALRRLERGTPELQRKIRDAIRSGFAWLAANFAVRKNPRGNKRWHYYYLYGLERACEIHGTKILNGRRWYFEGAEFLLARQKGSGAWRSLEDTCFAILFLKKAAPPVVTGQR